MKGFNWEVGSTWYADDFCPAEDYTLRLKFIADSSNVTLLSTCRSAIKLILDKIGGQHHRALVPSFTCHSVIDPFLTAGYDVKGYSLNENLQIDIDVFSSLVNDFRPDIILVHGYFGFNTVGSASNILESCKARGIIVIEDKTQTMFSDFKAIAADYTIGSIRKWLPIPDGAFIKGMHISELTQDSALADAKIKAMRAKNRYFATGDGNKCEFMRFFADAENLLDSRTLPHSISSYSLSALTSLNLKEFANRRRDNYNLLARRLSRHSEIQLIFKEALTSDVPFLLPVYIDDKRAEFQRYMASHNVYPTIIWKCPDALENIIDKDSRRIYDRILCFHVDQRYEAADMNKVADIVDSYFSN